MRRKQKQSIWKSIDWVTVLLYMVLVTCGWFSICGASYTYGETDLFSFDYRSGKQLVWIGCSLGIGFILLMLEEKMYELLAYLFYGAMMVLLLVTPFLARDIKGSLSWIDLGPVRLQPAEFAKYATALALAKMMSAYGFHSVNFKYLRISYNVIIKFFTDAHFSYLRSFIYSIIF